MSLKNNVIFFFFLIVEFILNILFKAKGIDMCMYPFFYMDVLAKKKLAMTGVDDFYRLRGKFYINRISEVK